MASPSRLENGSVLRLRGISNKRAERKQSRTEQAVRALAAHFIRMLMALLVSPRRLTVRNKSPGGRLPGSRTFICVTPSITVKPLTLAAGPTNEFNRQLKTLLGGEALHRHRGKIFARQQIHEANEQCDARLRKRSVSPP